MKTTRYFAITIFMFFTQAYSQFNYQRSWGTYLGNELFYFSDSEIDSQGNIYIVGTTMLYNGAASSDLTAFTTPGAYHTAYGGGYADGFIAKFSPTGELLWGTFVGGEDTDYIEGIDIDSNDNLYIVGTTQSTTNIATAGSYQPVNAGLKDFFVMKMTTAGAVVWSTYFGGSASDGEDIYAVRNHIALGDDNYFYISGNTGTDTLGTLGVFQETKGNSNYHISQFDTNGNRIWTTYYGVYNKFIAGINANATGVYVTGTTFDVPPSGSYNTYYGTVGAHQPVPGNFKDAYLSKFNTTGQREWSTYYGGNKPETVGYNSIALYNDKVYFSGTAQDYVNNEIATAGSFQPISTNISNFVAQFSENGTRIFGTYNGNAPSGGSNPESGVNVDSSGNFYNFGGTFMDMDITTTGAYQEQLNNNTNDAFVCKYDAGGNKLWGTYYGGEGIESDVRFHQYADSFYIVGFTSSETGISTPGAYQPIKQIFDAENTTNRNIFIAHFEPKPLSNSSFESAGISLYPNPSKGSFTIAFKNNTIENATVEIFDLPGKQLLQQNINTNETIVNTNDLSEGVYVVKIKNREGNSFISKIIIE